MRPRRAPMKLHERQAPRSALGPGIEFLRTLWAVDHGLAQLSAKMEAELGVTGLQRLALRIIGCRRGIGPAELSLQLHVHRSVATGLVRRLEAKRLVRRQPDPSDARRWQLELTPGGHRLDCLEKGTIESRVRRVLADSSVEEYAAARRLLERLAGALSVHD